MSTSPQQLPILIAGAGPCGLVAGLVLQQHDIPFVILEKATRAKLCSNLGAGLDLAPTATEILRNRLGLDHAALAKCLSTYVGICIQTMHGEPVRTDRLAQMKGYSSVNRAGLQLMLLNQLQAKEQDESKYLRCGAAVESFQEEKDKVTVQLTDGSTVVGRALLGCDGIHSKIRKCLYEGKDDPLHYCGAYCYWGKCKDLDPKAEAVVQETQPYQNEGGASLVVCLSTNNLPGSFFICPMDKKEEGLLWVAMFPSKDANKDTTTTDDLTRRGGSILTEQTKADLIQSLQEQNAASVMIEVIKGTPAGQITQAGIFDRSNLGLPFSSPGKLVALLGDAAHPQTPMLGQGVNMAIVDAYVLATTLAARKSAAEAIEFYDSKQRRKEAELTVATARKELSNGVSSSWFFNWFVTAFCQYAPLDLLINELQSWDKSNVAFVQRLEEKVLGKTPPQQQEERSWLWSAGAVAVAAGVVVVAAASLRKTI